MNLFLYFIVYSFLGWTVESAYVSAENRKFINRGFLNGPVCPIYGFGAIIIIFALAPFKSNVPLVFIAGMVLASLLEYFVGYILENLFHAKWWDYSSHKFNINGRVSLLNSIYWGILSVILLGVLHPLIENLILKIPYNIGIIISWVLFSILLTDMAVTIPAVISLNIRLKNLHKLYTDLQERINIVPFLQEKAQELHDKYNLLISKRNILHRRLISAFPNLRSIKFDHALTQLKNKIRINKIDNTKEL